MAIFAISFRLEYNSTYDARYASLVDAIKGEAGSQWWAETSSFFLIESDKSSSSALCTHLDQNSSISPSDDLLLVINLSAKGYATAGHVKDGDLHKLMKLR